MLSVVPTRKNLNYSNRKEQLQIMLKLIHQEIAAFEPSLEQTQQPPA